MNREREGGTERKREKDDKKKKKTNVSMGFVPFFNVFTIF
jgi:hypothetical protein